jgi:AcrR family transcriptional regulator
MTAQRGRGRPAISSREAIERVAMRLFLERGYAATTIQMIATESQVSRTSVFRYWGSKSEIVWSEFDVHTSRLRDLLRTSDPRTPTMSVVRECVVENLRLSMNDSALWLERFAVLDSAPELRPEEHAHWVAWAGAVAAFVADRHGLDPGDVVPQSIGGAVQAAFLAVLRRWLHAEDRAGALLPALDDALVSLCGLLQGWLDHG